MVLHRSDADGASPAEWGRLFSTSTRTGIVLPLISGPMRGLLLIGEERTSRYPAIHRDRLALLEFVASRIADILALSGFLTSFQTSARGRQIRLGEIAERQRLAQEVHDSVGQALTALLLRLRWAIGQSRTTLDELRIFEAVAKDALESTRALAFRLRRPDPDEDAIQLARDFAEPVLDALGCRLSWVDERGDIRVDPQVAHQIGRVIRESVTNIARHTRAKLVEVRVESLADRVQVSIHDDGPGFSPDAIGLRESGQGLGLLENREALAAIGGRFAITSSSQTGTLVVAEAPWRRARKRL
jgi:signal transduction histidine kinase